jgi:hypothetical protein
MMWASATRGVLMALCPPTNLCHSSRRFHLPARAFTKGERLVARPRRLGPSLPWGPMFQQFPPFRGHGLLRRTVNLKTSFVLAVAATLAIPLPLMRLSTPVTLTAEVSFPPGPSRSNRWPLELCYGPLKYCRWRLGNQDGCPGGGDRWLCKANH